MKKHSSEQTFNWAKDWGIPGYDHLDPKLKAQQIQRALNPKKRDERGGKPWRKNNRRRSYK